MGGPELDHAERLTVSAEEYALVRRIIANHDHAQGIGSHSYATASSPRRQAESATTRMGNASSLGISVFAIANSLIGLHLMQARGVRSDNLLVGVLWFTGGVASWVACVFELLLGNTFAYCVFGSFGGYYFAYAATLTPAFAIASGYEDPAQYADSMGLFFCIWAVLFFVFLVVSTRTNVIFVWIFVLVDATAWCLAASFFQSAKGEVETSLMLAKAAGGMLFAAATAGWYLLASQLFEAVDFPVKLPIGMLNSKRAKEKIGEP